MLNFLKKKVSLDVIASMMAKMAFLHLTQPTEEDFRLIFEATDEGVDRATFLFEMFALLSFAIMAIVNRDRLEGKLKDSMASQLILDISEFLHKNLVAVDTTSVFPPTVHGEAAFDLLTDRMEAYSKPVWGPDSVEETSNQIAALFAGFCGFPKSTALKNTGLYLLIGRGNVIGQWLDQFRLVP